MSALWKPPFQWLSNTYFLLGLSFLVWMLFFDAEDFITQYKLRNRLRDLEAEKAYYLKQIAKIQQDSNELVSNASLLEKVAREKFFMKKKTEDLYIVVDE
mmetsp:Transcript_9808/g.22639  ORF Transcript_9808/g.22639 Transcript_9808/m.22639 type:complete len:100 (-) Transcript_9808:574-873(-)